jgi:hypothetical protein
MNRAYGPILLVLLLTWFVKVYSHPFPTTSTEEFFRRAHVGPLSGGVVTVILIALMLGFLLLFFSSLLARPPLGELRARPRSYPHALWESFTRPYLRPGPRRTPVASGAQQNEG